MGLAKQAGAKLFEHWNAKIQATLANANADIYHALCHVHPDRVDSPAQPGNHYMACPLYHTDALHELSYRHCLTSPHCFKISLQLTTTQ